MFEVGKFNWIGFVTVWAEPLAKGVHSEFGGCPSNRQGTCAHASNNYGASHL